MKNILFLLLPALLAAATLSAQTPEEIIARVDQETARFDAEGCSMVMELKFPIIGAVATTIYTRGDKYKMIMSIKGDTSISWSDGVTDWDYESSKNTVTIKPHKADGNSEADNAKMMEGITEGYDVRLKKETADTWQFRCTKSKTNTNKDDPKNMDLVVSKATYLPVSLTARAGGLTITMRDVSIGVSEQEVTFDASKYATAKIIDER
jgi:outer membrane lipoprotein-sorting protein